MRDGAHDDDDVGLRPTRALSMPERATMPPRRM
jgi:hypothetical protein